MHIYNFRSITGVLRVFLMTVAIHDRILDNLPLVVPIRRTDLDSSIVYQHGFHVGLRGQYAGVGGGICYWLLVFLFLSFLHCSPSKLGRSFLIIIIIIYHRARRKSILSTITWHLKSSITKIQLQN